MGSNCLYMNFVILLSVSPQLVAFFRKIGKTMVALQNVCCFLSSIFLPNVSLDESKMHVISFGETNGFSAESFDMGSEI